MTTPLRIAWLGHQSTRAGDGLLTYSREMVAGLRARGAKVFFVHHGTLDAAAADTIAVKSWTGSHRYINSSAKTKRIITEMLRHERLHLIHVSLSVSNF